MAAKWLQVDEGSEGQRLDNYLLKLLKGVPKTHIYRVIRSGEVRVNKGRAGADTRLAIGDEVRVPPMRLPDTSGDVPAPAREFPVIWEDDYLIAIDKPAGVAVHGGSGVSSGVIEQLRQARPDAKFLELVHRIDRETSGLLLVAKRRSALTHLQDQFRDHHVTIGKTYAALVVGDWPARRKVIDVPLYKFLTAEGDRRVRVTDADDAEGRRSITLVSVAERFAGFSLLDVVIKTGRTHQIRVHLAHEGHVIVGDPKYGDFTLNKAVARGDTVRGCRFDRMFLHARRLRFVHPATAEVVELEAPMPAECVALLQALAKSSAVPNVPHSEPKAPTAPARKAASAVARKTTPAPRKPAAKKTSPTARGAKTRRAAHR
ncbi:MAG: rluC [Rhizobacter sp.]|nr:rluC [Rhizobacter sp.]